jgi:uncharacterized membrane protein
LILTTQPLTAQSVESLKNKKTHKKNANDIITEFSEFLNYLITASPSNLRDNADFIMSMMYRKALKRTTVAR